MSRRLPTALLALAIPFGASPLAAGEIAHYTFPSDVLGRDYPYTVYLPDGYGDSDLDYPTLYLLHGSFGDENDWAVHGATCSAPPTGLIAAGARSRRPSSSCPAAESWWVDGYNEPAETAFVEDLISHVENAYRVIGEREGRVIGGLSAGGYGTVNLVLEHPELFAAGAALSPASYVPVPPESSSGNRHPAYLDENGEFDADQWQSLNYTAYIDDYKAQGLVVPLYINSGDHDVFDIAYHAAVLYQALREHQPDAVEYRVVDGDHEWRVWRDTLPEAMTYVFSHASRPRGAAADD